MRNLTSFLMITLLTISSAAAAPPTLPTATAPRVALATAGAAASSTRQYVSFAVIQRTETSNAVTVDYVLGGRTMRLAATRSSTSSTLAVQEGSRTLLKVVTASDGTARLTNHRGETFTTAELRDDPELMAKFDTYALAVLDVDIAPLIVIGVFEPVPNPCAIHWAVAIGCLVGSYVAACCEWGTTNGGIWIECDCPVV